MIKPYLVNDQNIFYRVYDPIEEKFCQSGRGIYANGRSIWTTKGTAANAKNNMPFHERLVIKKFRLVEEIE
jgi:hypothetical protein